MSAAPRPSPLKPAEMKDCLTAKKGTPKWNLKSPLQPPPKQLQAAVGLLQGSGLGATDPAQKPTRKAGPKAVPVQPPSKKNPTHQAVPKAVPVQPPSKRPRCVPKAAPKPASDGAAAGGPAAVPDVYAPGMLTAARRQFMLGLPDCSPEERKAQWIVARTKLLDAAGMSEADRKRRRFYVE